MDLVFDPAKNTQNIADRGLSFELAAGFDFAQALIWQDVRQNYGEARYCALGFIGTRVHALVFTLRANQLRVISLRLANARETKKYNQTLAREHIRSK